MPSLIRPDGVELHWEERGSGPPVVLVCACMSFPAVFEDLVALMAQDQRVVTYDPRGTGLSTRSGPYETATDDADLEALLDEVGPAALVTFGDGCNRGVRVAARRPELVSAVITPGGNPLGRSVLGNSEGLAASQSVLSALIEMMRTDYRAALRTINSTTNPQMNEDQVRERVDLTAEYSPQDVTLTRLLAWIEDDASEAALAVGDKLWLLHHAHNAWFPLDVLEPTRQALPEAHVEQVDDGPLSRPDITAALVRQLVAAAA
jgi:pimeloyl-ACP methyl ester carboxylesterase